MRLTKSDFKKGQEVACQITGFNVPPDTKDYHIGVVKSVGKYVTVKVGGEDPRLFRFQLEDRMMDCDYLPQKMINGEESFRLFFSEQALFDFKEKHEKLPEIKRAVYPDFGDSDLSIEQVRRIHKIIFEVNRELNHESNDDKGHTNLFLLRSGYLHSTN